MYLRRWCLNEKEKKKKKRRILPGLDAAVWGVGNTKDSDEESIVETWKPKTNHCVAFLFYFFSVEVGYFPSASVGIF